MDYNQLSSNDSRMNAFKIDVQSSLATASGVALERVSVKSVSAGSVVVRSTVAMTSSAAAQSFLNRATASPGSVFPPSFQVSYGTVSVSGKKRCCFDIIHGLRHVCVWRRTAELPGCLAVPGS